MARHEATSLRQRRPPLGTYGALEGAAQPDRPDQPATGSNFPSAIIANTITKMATVSITPSAAR